MEFAVSISNPNDVLLNVSVVLSRLVKLRCVSSPCNSTDDVTELLLSVRLLERDLSCFLIRSRSSVANVLINLIVLFSCSAPLLGSPRAVC